MTPPQGLPYAGAWPENGNKGTEVNCDMSIEGRRRKQKRTSAKRPLWNADTGAYTTSSLRPVTLNTTEPSFEQLSCGTVNGRPSDVIPDGNTQLLSTGVQGCHNGVLAYGQQQMLSWLTTILPATQSSMAKSLRHTVAHLAHVILHTSTPELSAWQAFDIHSTPGCQECPKKSWPEPG